MEERMHTKNICEFTIQKSPNCGKTANGQNFDLDSNEILNRALFFTTEEYVCQYYGLQELTRTSPEFVKKRLKKQLSKNPPLNLPEECIQNILKKLPNKLCKKWIVPCDLLLQELKKEYVQSATEIFLGMTLFSGICLEPTLSQAGPFRVDHQLTGTSCVKNKIKVLEGNILYYFPFIRHLITEAQRLLPSVFIDCTKYSGFKGFYHPEILLSVMEKEIDREDQRMEFDWFGKLFMHVSEKDFFLDWKEHKVTRFINLIIQITKTIALDRIYDTLNALVIFFTDPKTTPKIAVQIYHSSEGNIVIIPSTADVYRVYCNLIKRVYGMGKNFVHFEMFHLQKGRRGYIPLEKYDNIRNTHEKAIKDFVTSIYLQLIQHYQKLSEKYIELMDDSHTSYARLSSMNMEELIAMADHYINIKGSINNIESNTYFTHFKANNKAMIKALVYITDCRIDQIMNEVLKSHIEYCKRHCEDFHSISLKAVKVPETTEELISLAKFMKYVNSDLMENMGGNILQYLELFYRVMEIVTVPQNYLEMMGLVLGWVSYIENIIKQNSTMLQATKFEFEERLNKVTEKLNEDLENFSSDELDGLDHLDDYSMINNYTLHIMKCLRKVQKFDETAKWINKEETLFEMTLSTYPELDEIKAFVNPFANLVFELYKWNMVYKSIMDGSLEALTVETVEATLEEYNNNINQLQKWFKSKIRQQTNENNPRRFKGLVDDSEYENWPAPLKLLHGAQQNLNEIKEHKAFVKLLCNPRMTEKHWKDISEIAGRDMTPYKGTSLRKFINFKIEDKMEEFEVISESAIKEYQLQENLHKMKMEWKDIHFLLTTSETTGDVILDSVDHIQSLIDDHLVKTLSIRSSAFVKPIEYELKIWYHKLGLINTTIDEWSKVQNQWLYYMPIFTSEAVASQMRIEADLFSEVDISYRQLLNLIQKNPLVMLIVCKEDILLILENCLLKFEKIHVGVQKYLEKKRLYFSRFFFLSDQDMINFLSEIKDPRKAQLFLKKCFSGISSLGFDTLLNIKSIISTHNEEVFFVKKVSTTDAKESVEKWLAQVEDQMIISVRDIMKRAISDYKRNNRKEWTQRWPGQAVHCVSQLYWANEIHNYFNLQKNHGLEPYYKHLVKQIDESIKFLQEIQVTYKRINLVSLIILEVHCRDVTYKLYHNNVISSSDFIWISQLRYYWENDVKARILNGNVKYGYEYLGNCQRLVVTPLAERCYRALITAYNLHYNAATEGPTSTGKTDIVKDLAQALAIYCHVFNCSILIDHKTIDKFLMGIASSGGWICLHEFDTMKVEILSVIAQQILCIIQALKQKLTTFMFSGISLTLYPTCSICVTLNPGYIGRSDLPSNLKVLFRPITMMVPDVQMIVEVFLLSNGFENYKTLALKLVTTFKLCSEMLPPQLHYDFGLRTMNIVLHNAKTLKSNLTNSSEGQIMMKSILSVISPKIPRCDLFILNGIIKDIFPDGGSGLVLPSNELLKSILEVCKRKKLQPVDEFLTKLYQTDEIMQVCHSLMLIGQPFGGKTTVIKVLSDTYNHLKESFGTGSVVLINTINPIAVSLEQLYGYYNPKTNDWTDGIIGKTFRSLGKKDSNFNNWVVFDGPVSPVWVEHLNSALDDKKKICLNTGEVIEIPSKTVIIFECVDLIEVSPSTISRCRMVYFESTSGGWKTLVESWNQNLPKEWVEDKPDRFISLFNWLIPLCSQFISQHCKTLVNLGIETTVRSACELTEMLLSDATDGQDLKYINTWAQVVVLQAVYWCFLGNLLFMFRETFDTFYRSLWQSDKVDDNNPEAFSDEIDVALPNDGMIEDNAYVFKGKGVWKYWPEVYKMMKFDEIYNQQTNIVTTLDILKYTAVMELFVKNKKPFLLLGPPGVGKTSIIRSFLLSLPNDEFIPSFLKLTHSETVSSIQEFILSKLIKKKKGVYGPSGNRTNIMFVDDIHLASSIGGIRPPLELIRLFLDHGYWYSIKNIEKIYLFDLFFIATMGFQNEYHGKLSPRFLRHFTLFNMDSFTEETLTKIFTTITFLGLRKNGFSADIMTLAQQVISATLQVYNSIRKTLMPTPDKCHYTFSIRDLMKVFQGFLMLRKESADGKKTFVRLWVHEILRVFSDKLITNADQDWLFNELRYSVEEYFKEEFDIMLDGLVEGEDTKITQITLSNLIFTTAFDGDALENQKYEEIPSMEAFHNLALKLLEEYNSQNGSSLDIIFFRYALEHVSRINRIISVPYGKGVLIGVNGTGRKALVKLAAFMAHQGIVQPGLSHDYGQSDWNKDLKHVLKESGAMNKSCVLLLNEDQLKVNYIIQDIDLILSTGEVPNLFAVNEVQDIIEMVRVAAQGGTINTDINPISVFEFFINRCKKNLHIILCFSPIGSYFRETVRIFRSIVNFCTIDWFETTWTLKLKGKNLETTGWPEDALELVAKEYLADVDLDEEVKDKIIDACKYFHVSARNMSNEFRTATGRTIYITSASYIDLLKHYRFWVKKKKNELEQSNKRYLGGLEKLEFAASQVEIMQRDLESLQPALKKAAEETTEMLKVIETETFEVEKASERVRLDEEIANEQAMGAMELKTECENDLALAIPILEDAVAALNTLKPADITLVKSMKNPPETVKLVLAAVCVMKGIKPDRLPDPKNPGRRINDYWGPSKRLLGDMTFLQQLKDYDKDSIPASTMKAVRSQYLNHKDFKPKVVAKASSAAEGLCKWVIALDKYDVVVKEVAPKKEKLRIAEKEYSETMAILEEKRNLLQGLEDKLAELKDNLKEANNRKVRLQNEVVLCSNKLQKAQRIIGSLGGEKDRWVEVAENLKKQYYEISGNILVSCGMIAYTSALSLKSREEIIADWCQFTAKMEIPISNDFSIMNSLCSSVLIEHWTILGLPKDTFSIENAVILKSSSKWPLLIDPQRQVNKWIKNLERNNGLKVIKLSEYYTDTVKDCLISGKPLLLENLQEELDSYFEPILEKNAIIEEGDFQIKLGDTMIEYHKDFRFYITTKQSNQDYSPEIQKKLTIINFSLTIDGLADKLLEIVAAKERPELQERRQNLLCESSNNKKELQDVEDSILKTLSSVVGNILEDENAVNSLDSSKAVAEEIKKKETATKCTRDEIEEFRQSYKPVSDHCSALYYTVTDLYILDPMYQYSLEWFLKIFKTSIDTASKTNITDVRISNIKEAFNRLLYVNTSYTLFEKDKILYSFILCKALLIKENLLDSLEVDILLGKEFSEISCESAPPPEKWIPEILWNGVTRINSYSPFENFLHNFNENIDLWKMFYFKPNPGCVDLPSPWNENLTHFQKLILLHAIRPDRLIPEISLFIKHEIGEQFIEPASFDLNKAFEESNKNSPIIVIIMPTTDPMMTVLSYVKKMNALHKFHCISLGDSQVGQIKKQLQEAQVKGDWIFLQNCHLSSSSMSALERIIETFDNSNIATTFRLLLSSISTSKFPISILENGVKMTYEAPVGLKKNLYQRYTSEPISNFKFYESCPGKEHVFTRLLYSISFFHAVICERRKFGPIGWNIPYNFDESDYLTSILQLQMLIHDYKDTPLSTLVFSMEEFNYGGKICDEWDKRTLITLLMRFVNEDVLTSQEYSFVESDMSYCLPVRNDYKDFIQCIVNLPSDTKPEVHGLNINAEIAHNLSTTEKFRDGLKLLFGGYRPLKPELPINKSKVIAEEILSKVPAKFNMIDVKMKYQHSYNQCMYSLMINEMEKLNELMHIIKGTLRNLVNALNGFSVLTPELEMISHSLLNGRIPIDWTQVSYPSLQSLGSYITNLGQRVCFIQEWCINGLLKDYWISGITNTHAFITSIILNHSRNFNLSINELSFDFELLDFDRAKCYPDIGVHVYGMFLNGASWDRTNHCIEEEFPMVVYDALPVLWIKPCLKDSISYTNRFICPLYKTIAINKSTLKIGHSSNYVLSVLLNTKKPNTHWITRGVAMACQIGD